MADIRTLSKASAQEVDRRDGFAATLRDAPIPPRELLQNLGLFINRQSLSRLLFLNELYEKIATTMTEEQWEIYLKAVAVTNNIVDLNVEGYEDLLDHKQDKPEESAAKRNWIAG